LADLMGMRQTSRRPMPGNKYDALKPQEKDGPTAAPAQSDAERVNSLFTDKARADAERRRKLAELQRGKFRGPDFTP